MTDAISPLSGAAPQGIDQDVLCPLCDYNLRGLTEARCPECGYRTTWDELRNRPPLHAYLFEHHPRRNFVSFVRTVLGSLLPRRFWRGVLPTMLIKPRRLYLFGGIVFFVALLGVLLGISGDIFEMARQN